MRREAPWASTGGRQTADASSARTSSGQRSVNGAELRDAESVLAQLSGRFDDYNTQAPHSALGMRSPANYRAEHLTLSSSR
jgi:hypothetical protein